MHIMGEIPDVDDFPHNSWSEHGCYCFACLSECCLKIAIVLYNRLVSVESTRHMRVGSDLWVESSAETHKFRTEGRAGGKTPFPPLRSKSIFTKSYNGLLLKSYWDPVTTKVFILQQMTRCFTDSSACLTCPLNKCLR